MPRAQVQSVRLNSQVAINPSPGGLERRYGIRDTTGMSQLSKAGFFKVGSVVALSVGLLSGLYATTAQAQAAFATPWTVVVYLNADHNLDSSALTDLEEMQKAGGGKLKNVRLVYYLDRNDDEEGDGPGVELGVIENGERKVVQKLPEQNSDDPKVLTNFITWTYKTYPGQKRGLVLWDHGGQWDGGFGGDEHGPGITKRQDHRAMSGAQTAAVAAGMKIDLSDFAARVGRNTGDAPLKVSATALQTAIASMTVAKSLGTQIQAASGLSVYLPVSKTTLPEASELVDYAGLTLNSGKFWSGCEAQWLSDVRGTKTPIGVTDIMLAPKASGYHVDSTPSGPSLDSALVSLYSVGSGDSITDYGDVYYEKTAARKQGFDWAAGVWSMSDGAGGISPLTADRDNPGEAVYSVDATYAPPGEGPFDVILRFDAAGQVVGALDHSGISPVGILLKPGGIIQLYVRTYKSSDARPDLKVLPQKLRVPANGVNGLQVGKVPLPSGKYQLAFSIFNVVGNDEGEAVDLPGR